MHSLIHRYLTATKFYFENLVSLPKYKDTVAVVSMVKYMVNTDKLVKRVAGRRGGVQIARIISLNELLQYVYIYIVKR